MQNIYYKNPTRIRIYNPLKHRLLYISIVIAILSIIPFWTAFSGDRLIYISKYVALVLFATSVVKLTKEEKPNLKKVILFSVTLLTVSFLNSFYIVNNLGVSAFTSSISSTLIFCSVGILAVFYFHRIPFDKFKVIILIFLIVVVALVNLPNLLLINNPFNYYTLGTRTRFFGNFTNANEMSRFALLGYLLSLRLWGLYKGSVYKMLFTFTIFSSIYLIYLSDSRASMLIVALSILLIIAARIYKKTPVKLLIPLLCIGFAISFGIVAYGLVGMNTLFENVNWRELSSDRSIIWSSVFNTTSAGLIFGVGSLQEMGIHNGYFEIVKYYGFLGLAVWLLILFNLIHKKIKSTQLNKTSSNLTGLSIVFLFLFYHFFEGSLVTLGNLASIYFWLEISQRNKE